MGISGYIHPDNAGFFLDEAAIRSAMPADSRAGDFFGLHAECLAIRQDSGMLCAVDGIITNLPELQKTFPTLPPDSSAAETILSLYQRDGEASFSKLRGPFALAIIDERNHRALLIRDPLGQRPLFLSHLPSGTWLFSTDLNSLAALPLVSRQPDLQSVSDFLSLGYIPAPRTIYRGIQKALPASITRFGTGVSTACYWEPPFAQKQSISFQAAVEQAQELLSKAVQRSLDALPPSGILLSGGIDSNLILALGRSSKQFTNHAFTVGFSDTAYDERSLAAESAHAFSTIHAVEDIKPSSWDRLLLAQQAHGEPFGDSSLIPTWHAMELAKQHGITAVLSGSGGDEIFGGYRRYQAMALRKWWQWIPSCLTAPLIHQLLNHTKTPLDARTKMATLKRFAAFWMLPPLAGYATFQEIFSQDAKNALFSKWTNGSAHHYLDDWQRYLHTHRGQSFVEQFNALDLFWYLPDDGCSKEALSAKLCGLSCLSPILDLDVAEFGLSLPTNFRVTCREKKRILRGIGKKLLPSILLKQGKRGFGMPVSDWFRNSRKDLLQDLTASVSRWDRHGWFDPQAIRRLGEEHLNGIADHGSQLWVLLALKCWLDAHSR